MDSELEFCHTNLGYENTEDSNAESELPGCNAKLDVRGAKLINEGLVTKCFSFRNMDFDEKKLSRLRLKRSNLRNTIAAIRSSKDSGSIKKRKSGSGVESDEDIDWSWLREVARDINAERLAHGTGNCCTGSVTVEPWRKGDNCTKGNWSCNFEDGFIDSNVNNIHNEKEDNVSVKKNSSGNITTSPIEYKIPPEESTSISEITSEVSTLESVPSPSTTNIPAQPTSTAASENQPLSDERIITVPWLRTSMRRLRHLRLPSDSDTHPTQIISTIVTESSQFQQPQPDQSSNVQMTMTLGAIETSSLSTVRPFSAPSRIPASEGNERSLSRSRSRDRVSGVPGGGVGGRGRSSSASSRSRRPRSLSSSVSSLASSIDTSPGCTLASQTVVVNSGGNNLQENVGGNAGRR